MFYARKIFIMLSFFIATASIAHEHQQDKKQCLRLPNNQKICLIDNKSNGYLPYIMASAITGAITGGLTSYCEQKLKIDQHPLYLLWLLLCWSAEIEMRTAIVDGIQDDIQNCDIKKKEALSRIARLASWISYFAVPTV